MMAAAAWFFFETRLGKAALAAAGLAALVTVFAWDQRARGAAGALTHVENSNATASKPTRLALALALALAILPLAACETLTPALTKGGALDAFKPIANSARAPCGMQREVAEHNSAYDTLKGGRAVTYKAPCDVDRKPPPPAPKPEPAAPTGPVKTS
jgi:hypothetical protein